MRRLGRRVGESLSPARMLGFRSSLRPVDARIYEGCPSPMGVAVEKRQAVRDKGQRVLRRLRRAVRGMIASSVDALEAATWFSLDLFKAFVEHSGLLRVLMWAAPNAYLGWDRYRMSGLRGLVASITEPLTNFYSSVVENLRSVAKHFKSPHTFQNLLTQTGLYSETQRLGMAAEEVRYDVLALVVELHRLRSSPNCPIEYENIGPAPYIEDLGTDMHRLSARRAGVSNCYICLEPFTSLDSPFKLTACSHIIGYDCMRTWLQSPSPNVRTCPECRTELCEPRRRRLISGQHRAYADGLEKLERKFGRVGQVKHCIAVCQGQEAQCQFTTTCSEYWARELAARGIDIGFLRELMEASSFAL
ncbi:hypothetical protein BDV96DRAFT_607429 [Lophiotrema nucula]|uniref:RING-type domain-containing protein n=1 Tax=Lophiotrema nucula TaxID=690887 RepID=A0A6A5YGI5_9PLEO|nr:hypothetical protein BDV96DRAFT_607429 [Lophiotrema nucula]